MSLRTVVAFAVLLSGCGDDTQPDVADGGTSDALSADALPDVDAQAPCTAVPTHLVSGYRMPAVAFTTDTEQTITLPNGFAVHGTVTLASPPPYTYSGEGWTIAYDRDTHTSYPSFGGSAQTVTSSQYHLVLPAGRYEMKFAQSIYTTRDPYDSPWGEYFQRNAYETLDVCGDATHDVLLPALDLAPRDVVVHGLDRFGPGPWSVVIQYGNQDDTFVSENDAVDVYAPTAVISLDLPLDAATARMNGVSLTEASPFDSTVPPIVTVSGTISNSMTPSTSSIGVGCYPVNAQGLPDPMEMATPLGNSVGTGGSMNGSMYTLQIPRGTNCALALVVTFNSTVPGWFASPAPSAATTETFSADVTRDFAAPDVQPITVTVHLRDPNGQPVPAYLVALTSTSLDGNLAGDYFMTSNAADANGTVQFSIPSGTYDISVEQPPQ